MCLEFLLKYLAGLLSLLLNHTLKTLHSLLTVPVRAWMWFDCDAKGKVSRRGDIMNAEGGAPYLLLMPAAWLWVCWREREKRHGYHLMHVYSSSWMTLLMFTAFNPLEFQDFPREKSFPSQHEDQHPRDAQGWNPSPARTDWKCWGCLDDH